MGDEELDLQGLVPASAYIDTTVRASSEFLASDPFAPQAQAAAPQLSDDTVDFSETQSEAKKSQVSVMAEMKRDPDLKMAAALFEAAGLADQIEADARQGGVSVYAPTNEAIQKLPAQARAKLLARTAEGKNVRARLMGAHVVPANSGIQALGNGAMSAAQFGWEEQGPVAQTKGTYTSGAVLTEDQAPKAGSEHSRTVLHNPQRLDQVRAQTQVIRTNMKNVPSISFKIHSVDSVLAKLPSQ